MITVDRSEKVKRGFRSKPQDRPKIRAILRRTWMEDLDDYGMSLSEMFGRKNESY